MDTILPQELDDLFPSSEDEERSDKDLTHLLQKARKYGNKNHRGHRRGQSNQQKRKSKYEQYLHAAGGLLARKAAADVGHAVGGKHGAAAGRLMGMYAANPSKFGNNPHRVVNAAVGRRPRRNGRRRGKKGRRGRAGRGRGGRHGRRGGHGGHGGRGGHGGQRAHRGLGGSGGEGGGGGSGESERKDDEEESSSDDEGYDTDSSGTSSDWSEE